MKIHLCCGDVYLDGYVNVDAIGPMVGKTNPNITTFDNYYKHKDHIFKKPIVDILMKLPREYDFKEVDEVLMISAFEHFTVPETDILLAIIWNSLKSGGVFKFDFPDILKTIEEYYETPEYMMRLIYGSSKNLFSFHKQGYTKESIKTKLKHYPWTSITIGDIVKHDYPMIGVTAVK